ncbi:PQQ-binding-like beta-propeller repeat protein [Bacteroidota bacterium]
MKKISLLPFLLILPFTCCLQISNNVDPQRQWSMYRGYFASGVLDNANLPDTWDAESGENIMWKIEVPGLGLSSPVIWGDKLFITTAISEQDKSGLKTGIYGDIDPVEDESEHEWIVYCLDKHTGKILWERTSHKGIPEQKRHPKSTHANSSVATDGNYVVAFFGSEGLYCYDLEGELQWEKDFGILRSVFFIAESAEWEFASSPIIHEGVVIIQCDVMENSFIAAYDVTTGKELWKQSRDEYPGWCTPNIYTDGERKCIAVNGYKHTGGYDFNTGEEIWKFSGGGDIPIPTPIVGEGMIYFNSAHGRQSPILAVNSDASGDITLKEDETVNEHIPWSIPRGGSYMQTLLLYKGLLYNLGWNGRLWCFDAKTGKEIYREKLGGAKSFTASPVAADGRIYAVSDDGVVHVVQSGDNFKVLTENGLNDVCMVTPAITDGIIYFRTASDLIAVSEN